MNNQLRTALINYAVSNFRAFGAFGKTRAASAGLDITGFATVFEEKLAKIEAKGKLGPKGWARLQAACPDQAKSYFSGLYVVGSGPDLTTVAGVFRFVDVSRNLAQEAGVPISQREDGLVDGVLAALGDDEEEVDEDDE